MHSSRRHHLNVNLSALSAAKSTPTVKQECVCVFEEVSTTPGVRKAFLNPRYYEKTPTKQIPALLFSGISKKRKKDGDGVALNIPVAPPPG